VQEQDKNVVSLNNIDTPFEMEMAPPYDVLVAEWKKEFVTLMHAAIEADMRTVHALQIMQSDRPKRRIR
jgi:hypothetical protein